MKLGRNDPCRCGSGKKYKDCCYEKDNRKKNYEFYLQKRITEFEKWYAEFKAENKQLAEIDELYASIKAYNDVLLHKANFPDYIGANFTEAIDLAITSNALSLIRGIFQKNHYSITHALNLRNIIECFTLLFMDEKGDISDTQKQLFVEQYKLIEYESYAKDGGEKFKKLLDIEELQKRYNDGKEQFLKEVKTESKLKGILKSRLPFLCNEKLNYNKLIEDYWPKEKDTPIFLQMYIFLSRMVHPSSYESLKDKKLYDSIFWVVIKLVVERYKDKHSKVIVSSGKKLPPLPYYKEQAVVYGFWYREQDNYALKLLDILNEQCRILENISDEFERIYGKKNYIEHFLDEVSLVLHDINTDSQLGYTENVKIKFKVVAEMFACFYKVYCIPTDDDVEYFYKMLSWHDVIKGKEQFGLEITDDEKEMVYNRYKKKYPLSNLSKDEFFKEYDKPLGFLVDGKGNEPNFTQLVDEYLEKQYKDNVIASNNIKFRDYYNIVYKESNNMSHGCGYLFFTNIGAWMDDMSVIIFLDNAITDFLFYVGIIFTAYAEEHENNKIISELLVNSRKEMLELAESKTKIITEIERVEKNY